MLKILPGSIIGEGSAVGCMSLVKKELKEYSVYAGVPCKFLKERSKNFLKFTNDI